ncbi:MAG: hypothetical protein DLM68_08635 [Hyphomicrobiales bacterium]|nr:MAG: hypothetical protein DLM68_08635 [Hyphomicrobiales bacterium]
MNRIARQHRSIHVPKRPDPERGIFALFGGRTHTAPHTAPPIAKPRPRRSKTPTRAVEIVAEGSGGG